MLSSVMESRNGLRRKISDLPVGGGGLELRLGSQAFLFSILVMQFITSVTHEDYFNGTKLHILHLKKS